MKYLLPCYLHFNTSVILQTTEQEHALGIKKIKEIKPISELIKTSIGSNTQLQGCPLLPKLFLPSLIIIKNLLWLSIKIPYEIFNIDLFLSAELTCNYEGHNILFSEVCAHYILQSKGSKRRNISKHYENFFFEFSMVQPISASWEEISLCLIVCALCPTSWSSQLVLAEVGGFKVEFPWEKKEGLQPCFVSYRNISALTAPAACPVLLEEMKHMALRCQRTVNCANVEPGKYCYFNWIWKSCSTTISSYLCLDYQLSQVWLINIWLKGRATTKTFFSVIKKTFPSQWITWHRLLL